MSTEMMRPSSFPTEDVWKYYQEGHTLVEVSKKFGYSDSWCCGRLHKAGHRLRKTEWTKDEDTLLQRIYGTKGLKSTIARQCAELLPHRPQAGCWQRAQHLGLQLRQPLPFTEEEDTAIREVYMKSKAYGEIMKGLGRLSLRHSVETLKQRAGTLGVRRLTSHLPPFDRLPVLRLSEAEKSWLACAIDAEGTISVHKRGSRYFSAAIIIGNTNREFLDFFLKLTGTSHRRLTVDRDKTKRCKDCFKTEIRDMPRVFAVLETIRPYLIIKRQQADLLIRFIRIQDEMIRQKRTNKQKMLQTPEQLEIVAQMRRLNQKGVHAGDVA